jgi:fructose-bisphosphate aldolase class II
MALVTLSEVLKKAKEGKYAVGAFNAINLDTARGIIAAAEEKNSPVILSLAEVHFPMAPLNLIGPLIVRMAKESSVPVVVHLDHGVTFTNIVKAMNIGFSSVMYDGSALDINENLQNTIEIVKIAKTLGVSVEAEVGKLVSPETGSNEAEKYQNPEDFFTNIEEAKNFVNKSGVDALAIAFGTAHGLYKSKPKLNFDLVNSISSAITIPLVMHGGSGLSTKDYKEAIKNGICKINYYSDMAFKVSEKIKMELANNETFYIHDISQMTIEFVKKHISNVMDIFESTNKA